MHLSGGMPFLVALVGLIKARGFSFTNVWFTTLVRTSFDIGNCFSVKLRQLSDRFLLGTHKVVMFVT